MYVFPFVHWISIENKQKILSYLWYTSFVLERIETIN